MDKLKNNTQFKNSQILQSKNFNFNRLKLFLIHQLDTVKKWHIFLSLILQLENTQASAISLHYHYTLKKQKYILSIYDNLVNTLIDFFTNDINDLPLPINQFITPLTNRSLQFHELQDYFYNNHEKLTKRILYTSKELIEPNKHLFRLINPDKLIIFYEDYLQTNISKHIFLSYILLIDSTSIEQIFLNYPSYHYTKFYEIKNEIITKFKILLSEYDNANYEATIPPAKEIKHIISNLSSKDIYYFLTHSEYYGNGFEINDKIYKNLAIKTKINKLLKLNLHFYMFFSEILNISYIPVINIQKQHNISNYIYNSLLEDLLKSFNLLLKHGTNKPIKTDKKSNPASFYDLQTIFNNLSNSDVKKLIYLSDNLNYPYPNDEGLSFLDSYKIQKQLDEILISDLHEHLFYTIILDLGYINFTKTKQLYSVSDNQINLIKKDIISKLNNIFPQQK